MLEPRPAAKPAASSEPVKESPTPTPEPVAETPEQPTPEPAAEPVSRESVATPEEVEVSPSEEPTTPTEEKSEDFATCWQTMFDEVFASNPMIYYPLKDKIPELKDGVIKVEVLNDFQKDQYEMRKRALLEYWRNHFSIDVDDLEVVTNENLEVKKIIYSSDDKMQNMAEQNPEFVSFLKELNFRIKD